MRMLFCPVCKQTKAVKVAKPKQKTCSKACAWKLRSPEQQRQQMANALKAAAKARRLRMLERWRAKYPNMDPEAARAIYNAGYTAGYTLGDYRGYRKGWAAACGEDWDTERKTA